MKQLTMAALLLSLGSGGLYAQNRPVRMEYSGSMVATTIELAPDSITDEEHLAGTGALGRFTLRMLRTDELTATPKTGPCGTGFGPNIGVIAGGGVFRFEDGSLLNVRITGGVLCVDFTSDVNHPVGHLTETLRIAGGTGRFKRLSASCETTPQNCTLTLTGLLAVAVFDVSGTSPKLLTNTGEIQGTLPVFAAGASLDGEMPR